MPLHVSSTVVLFIRRSESSLNLFTGRPPTGVMIPDAV